ncbi:MAG: hypothetical protein NT027_08675 [Proteobacteria bacterium]|nr:hypothetical protein [Pseudomonadota bacterium]
MTIEHVLRPTSLILCLSTFFYCGRKGSDDDQGSNPPPQELAPSAAPAAPTEIETPPNEFGLRLRGNTELSRIIDSSLGEGNRRFNLGGYLSDNMQSSDQGLPAFLGYFDGNMTNPTWRNVDPTTVGSLAYIMAFDKFATDIGRMCSPENFFKDPSLLKAPEMAYPLYIKINLQAKNLFLKICSDRTAQTPLDDSLKALWTMLTQNYVFASDYDLWLSNLKAETLNASNSQFIGLAVSTAYMHPEIMFQN